MLLFLSDGNCCCNTFVSITKAMFFGNKFFLNLCIFCTGWSSHNSADLWMFRMCLTITVLSTPNRLDICDCVSHTVSFPSFILLYITIFTFVEYQRILFVAIFFCSLFIYPVVFSFFFMLIIG